MIEWALYMDCMSSTMGTAVRSTFLLKVHEQCPTAVTLNDYCMPTTLRAGDGYFSF